MIRWRFIVLKCKSTMYIKSYINDILSNYKDNLAKYDNIRSKYNVKLSIYNAKMYERSKTLVRIRRTSRKISCHNVIILL